MKPLFVLLILFTLLLGVTKCFTGKVNVHRSGRLALAGMLVFTSMGHFLYTEGMSLMVPPWVPARASLVYISGAWEIIAAIGLLSPRWREFTAVLLIVFFLLVLPLNIYAAFLQVDYEAANYQGRGLAYLWFRVPFQFFLIGWVYIFVLVGRSSNKVASMPFTEKED